MNPEDIKQQQMTTTTLCGRKHNVHQKKCCSLINALELHDSRLGLHTHWRSIQLPAPWSLVTQNTLVAMVAVNDSCHTSLAPLAPPPFVWGKCCGFVLKKTTTWKWGHFHFISTYILVSDVATKSGQPGLTLTWRGTL